MILRFLYWVAVRLALVCARPPYRETCELCCLKHLGQARALLLEARSGYPLHFWYALGHLAEAQDEISAGYPALAEKIRAVRKKIERRPDYAVEFDALVEEVSCAAGLALRPEDFR